jgi:hypothetical protein
MGGPSAHSAGVDPGAGMTIGAGSPGRPPGLLR